MALYKYPYVLQNSSDPAFDMLSAPGSVALYSGIYRCTSCGDEFAIARGHKLPEVNHRMHAVQLGPVAWQLVIFPVIK